MSTTSIPIVDLNDLSGSDPSAIARAAEGIRVAFGHYGLVYLRNHGVDSENVDALYDEFLQFTSRPHSEKSPYGRADIWYQRGWTPPNVEKAVVAGGQPDFKECYFIAPVPGAPEMAAQYPELYCENIFPDASPGFDPSSFRRRYLEMGNALERAGEVLLRGCAAALGLPLDIFVSIVQGGPHVTRLLHYLPLNKDQVNTNILWGEEHTDFNLLTLLPGGRFYDASRASCPRPDDKSGLYLRTRPSEQHPHGEMVRGLAPAGCIVAQVGQQLETLTGGRFLATPHVVTAPGVPGYSRASAAHFVHAHSNRVLFPLPEFQNPESVRTYSPPVLAGTYSIKTLFDIGLAPQEALNRLGYRQYDRLGAIRRQSSSP